MRNSYYNYRNVIAILKSTQGLTLRGMNEQTVNQLNIRLNKNHSFTAAESAILFYIAMQCPYTGGASVYTARALYAVVNDTLDFHDMLLCNDDEMYFRKEQNANYKNETEIRLYPNPATSNVTIYGLEAGTENKIQIINSYGKEVLSVTAYEGNYIINTSLLPAGVYIVRIINSVQYSLKLVIMQ